MKTQFDFENNRALYQLAATDLTTLNIDTIFNYIHIIPDGERIFQGASYSVANNILYFTNDYENEIIGVDSHNQIEEKYKFEIESDKENLSPKIVHSTRAVFNNYISFHYQNGLDEDYCFLYNKSGNVRYNVRLRRDAKHKLISGIRDDILNTGYFELRQTNIGDYAFYIRPGYEVPDTIKVIDEVSPVIFLIKLK